MPYQLMSPPKIQATSQARKLREKIDLVAQQERLGWKGAMELAMELFGKKEGLSIGQSKKLMEEIKRRRK